MASVDYTEFLQWVRPFAPHAPEPTQLVAVRDACIEFCTDTKCLQEALEVHPFNEIEPEFELIVRSGYSIAHILVLYFEGRRLSPVGKLMLNSRNPQDWRRATGTPLGYLFTAPDLLRLVPSPAAAVAEAISGDVALTPKRSSERVDESVFEEHGEAVAWGALARLLIIPDQPYTDLMKAGEYRRKFREAIGAARIDWNEGDVAAELSVQMRPW